MDKEKINSKKVCLTQAEKEQAIEAISQRISTLECPMCKKHEFLLGEGYITNILQFDLKVTHLTGKSIPTIPIICKHCGFVSQHALGVLNMLDNQDKSPK